MMHNLAVCADASYTIGGSIEVVGAVVASIAMPGAMVPIAVVVGTGAMYMCSGGLCFSICHHIVPVT